MNGIPDESNRGGFGFVIPDNDIAISRDGVSRTVAQTRRKSQMDETRLGGPAKGLVRVIVEGAGASVTDDEPAIWRDAVGVAVAYAPGKISQPHHSGCPGPPKGLKARFRKGTR